MHTHIEHVHISCVEIFVFKDQNNTNAQVEIRELALRSKSMKILPDQNNRQINNQDQSVVVHVIPNNWIDR